MLISEQKLVSWNWWLVIFGANYWSACLLGDCIYHWLLCLDVMRHRAVMTFKSVPDYSSPSLTACLHSVWQPGHLTLLSPPRASFPTWQLLLKCCDSMHRSSVRILQTTNTQDKLSTNGRANLINEANEENISPRHVMKSSKVFVSLHYIPTSTSLFIRSPLNSHIWTRSVPLFALETTASSLKWWIIVSWRL